MPALEDINGLTGGPRTDPQLREALSRGGVGLWSWDLTSDRFFADEVTRSLWGLQWRGEVPSERVLDSVHPADAERVRTMAEAARDGDGEADLTFRVRRPTGEVRWTRVRAHVSDSIEGRRLVGVAIDITERMRAESALTATEARLQRAQALGGALPFEWDARTDTIVAAPAFKALYGLSPDEPMSMAVFLSRVHLEDRERVEEDQVRLIAAPGPYESEFRVVLPSGAVRWILSRGESVRDGDGTPSGIAGIAIDITARKAVEEELRQSKREARTRFREVRALYQHAPVGLALLDLDLRFVRVNEFLRDITGLETEEHVGRPLFAILPDLRAALEPVLRQVIATGEPVRNVEVEGGTPRAPDAKVWWRLHVYYLSDDYGATPGIGLVAEDVTAQKRAEHARDLLARELSHRIKNLFAVVASIVSLSARGNDALKDFARTVRARIEALGRAHDYVRPAEWDVGAGGASRTLHGLLDGLLRPYQEQAPERVRITGDDPAIGSGAATALGLALHEFATNAVKYGALSEPGGAVEIACRGGETTFELVWTERGGPPVSGPPANEGFGSLLARRSITGDLGGTLDMDWAPEGLTLRVTMPAERLEA
ncbi:MAG TPA: PAS domain S-box protein [Beijerinckiaceae bacterium]